MTITITADSVSWYAAIVSTTIMIIQIINLNNDRKRVHLKINPNMIMAGQSQYKKDTSYISIAVINSGRRPVTIGTVGYITRGKNNQNGILTDSLSEPRELLEGKSTTYLIEQSLVEKANVKYFEVYDLTGKKYKKKNRLKLK